jgi:hypothetical protein
VREEKKCECGETREKEKEGEGKSEGKRRKCVFVCVLRGKVSEREEKV